MRLPIITYGDPILREKAKPVDPDKYPLIPILIDDMFETMQAAGGVGLAAPQIGISLRLFVVETTTITTSDSADFHVIRKAFINPVILEEHGQEYAFREGCLSIPGIMEMVLRKPVIKLSYIDEHWNHHEQTFSGLTARIIQHEFDHLNGQLFIDKIPPNNQRLIEDQLARIAKKL